MSYFNIWLAVSNTARAAYHARRQAEQNGEPYTGPMTDKAFRVLNRLSDHVVEGIYRNPTVGGKAYRLFSLYIDRADANAAQKAITDISDDYPNDVIVIGVWREDGSRVGNMHAQAWRFMPDQYTYNEDGSIATTIPATSNVDLRDTNLLLGQLPRSFA